MNDHRTPIERALAEVRRREEELRREDKEHRDLLPEEVYEFQCWMRRVSKGQRGGYTHRQ